MVVVHMELMVNRMSIIGKKVIRNPTNNLMERSITTTQMTALGDLVLILISSICLLLHGMKQVHILVRKILGQVILI